MLKFNNIMSSICIMHLLSIENHSHHHILVSREYDCTALNEVLHPLWSCASTVVLMVSDDLARDLHPFLPCDWREYPWNFQHLFLPHIQNTPLCASQLEHSACRIDPFVLRAVQGIFWILHQIHISEASVLLLQHLCFCCIS